MKTYRCLLVVALAFQAVGAAGIVRRHDRPDAAYLELAQDPRWQATVSVGGMAMGTLIAPEWVLTAAHVAQFVGPFERVVIVAGREYAVRAVHVHADYNGTSVGTDIALLHLAEPVTDVKPAPLYRGADEAGRAVVFVGHGDTGVGPAGPPEGNDRRWRAAQNRITVAQGATLRFDFDAPPAGEDLEGISGPGDSGGPAFIEADGRAYVAGISSANIPGTGTGICTYGTIEVYCRVSAQAAWIESAQAGRVPADGKWGEVRALRAGGWPDEPRFARVSAWFAARNLGEPAQLENFMRDAATADFLQRRTSEARAEAARDNWNAHGAITPVAWAEANDGTLSVLARTSKPDEWVDILFTFGADGKLDGAGTLALGRRTKFAFEP